MSDSSARGGFGGYEPNVAATVQSGLDSSRAQVSRWTRSPADPRSPGVAAGDRSPVDPSLGAANSPATWETWTTPARASSRYVACAPTLTSAAFEGVVRPGMRLRVQGQCASVGRCGPHDRGSRADALLEDSYDAIAFRCGALAPGGFHARDSLRTTRRYCRRRATMWCLGIDGYGLDRRRGRRDVCRV